MTSIQVGLFIGAWGVADAMARLFGTLLAGIMRDLLSALTGLALAGYIGVFLIQAGLLVVSLGMLRSIDTTRFRQESQASLLERAAMMNDV
jgi:BCD family chlorophyll transporter-like MFS transporter